jgi:hypothetical protein
MVGLHFGKVIAAGGLALAALGGDVRAAPAELSVASVMLCDKPDEVEAFVRTSGDDVSAKLTEINTRFGQESCNVVTAAFYRGQEAKTVLVPDGIVRIIKMEIVGVRQGDTWVSFQSPVEQYAGVREAATPV